jgi:tetratricopeptide (TPR) repeat protein
MKRCFICLIILLTAAVPLAARTVELTLHPVKAAEPEQKYRLLPKAEDLTEADAAPLYEKALQSLPSDLEMDEIDQWLHAPPDKLNRDKVRATLQRCKATLKLLEQAGRCKQCDWPYVDDDVLPETLGGYRRLAFLLCLEARFQMAGARYDEAIRAMQTGYAMARHLAKDLNLPRGLAGIGIGARFCGQLEQFAQRPEAPNLYQALRDLPHPFVDLSEQAEWEDADIKEKVHLLMNRLDRHLAALQCIEAIRVYASHGGKFPTRLSDVTELLLPNDPVTHKPFAYSCAGPNAVLEMTPLKKATDKHIIRYELSLKE